MGTNKAAVSFTMWMIAARQRAAEVEPTSFRAVGDVRVLVIDGSTLSALLDEHPRLASDLHAVIDIRRYAIEALHSKTSRGSSHASEAM